MEQKTTLPNPMAKGGFLFLALLTSLVLGCEGGTDEPSGNNRSTAPTPTWGDLTVDVATSTSDLSSDLIKELGHDLLGKDISVDSGMLVIDEIRLVIRDIRLLLANDNYATPRFGGPFLANLVSGGEILDEVTPAIGDVEAVPDLYDSALLRFDSLNEDDLPEEFEDDEVVTDWLMGNSIVVQGSFLEDEDNDIDEDGEVSSIPFVFSGNMVETIEIITSSPFNVFESDDNFLFIVFKIEEWFEDMAFDLQEVSPGSLNEDGLLVVSDEGVGELADIAEDIEENIEDSLGFGLSEDDIFDLDEEDDFATSDEEDTGFDSECINADGWDDACLDARLECEDACYEDDCFDDAIFEWTDVCVTEMDACVNACWE